MTLSTLLLLLTLVSCAFWLLACWCVREFTHATPTSRATYAPPVSVLKPVEGLDPQADANYRSFCQQDYPEYEILFAMQDTAQPVLPVLERLKREFPRQNIQIVTAEPLGVNAKVSNLHALAAVARHDILVISDSDMRVTPDYMRQVVAPLEDESVGVVTCLYRGEQAMTWAARFGVLYFAATYMPAAVVASRLIGLPVAFGSTMVLRRTDLERIGGFAAIKDHLADDYQLAARIAALGKRVVPAPYIVKTILGAESWRQVWQREVRWMRCIRASRPLEYPGVLLWFTLPLAVATAFAMDFDTVGRNLIVLSLLVRWGTAWLVAGYTDDSLARWMLPWLPLRDLMTFATWCAGVVGRYVEWRGERFRVLPNGRLATAAPGAPQPQTKGIHRKR